MTFKEFTTSKKFTKLLIVLGAVILMLGIFQAGVMVGIHRAGFSYHMGENYFRAFGERGHTGGMMGEREFPNAHGAVGEIVKVELPNIVVLGGDQIEKIVTIDTNTKIRHQRDNVAPESLAVGTFVVVIGAPTDTAEITARLIRIMPPPPNFTFADPTGSTTSSTPSINQ